MALLTTPDEFRACAEYRMLYKTPLGQIVITDQLTDLGLFQGQLNTAEDIALMNYARRLMLKCGIWQDFNMRGIVGKLFELPVSEDPSNTLSGIEEYQKWAASRDHEGD
jgi:hypothetical protein